ncbi:hypothetical protein K505DRAFT_375878 [Melanomma pulvis-pyrius CBS 109.77]|uniref:Uncharacterized protein n=1 Tax=Melanomma pulvis-pyrius CBS 109.77 TaxID=1314802 RepID=A0A6A6X8X4_9PLEO|nr:hypothetical protein K505DRAFT_375878 [Melanomma pulvis-pyrius CBS 109.77]
MAQPHTHNANMFSSTTITTPPFSKKLPVVSTSVHSYTAIPPGIQTGGKPKSRTAPFLSAFSLRRRGKQNTWQSNALRPSILIFSVLLSLSIIAILQYLLLRSQHDQGIQFAPKISALPLHKTFFWKYFPIIVIVVFSIFWAWIDLETKRLEPYYQMSKENGALGKDSLLLKYPFDFMPLVPITALKSRHWPVFFSSMAVVLVAWGIVPIQAGIFSTELITRTFPSTFVVSTSFIPASEQETKLSTHFARSTYGIFMLNETLPPYMTRNYALTPFKPIDAEDQSDGNWTAPTTLYSLDLQCEEAQAVQKETFYESISYESSAGLGGCSFGSELWQVGNETIGMPPAGRTRNESSGYFTVKEFSARHVGYWGNDYADESLEGYCADGANQTFLALFTRNKKREDDPPQNATSIYCKSVYYSQDVNATVDVRTKRPLEVVPLGTKQPLAPNIFNTSLHESRLNRGGARQSVREDSLPITTFPTYEGQLADTNLSMAQGGARQPMAALAALIDGLPLEQYINPEALGKSYEKAYRLLFVTSIVEVLDGNYVESKHADGQRHLSSEAVILEPVFTYIVEGLLSIVSIATVALLYLSVTREKNLQSDPNTIASVMSLVADNQPLLSELQRMDCCTMEEVENSFSHRRWKLVHDESQTGIIEVNHAMESEIPLLGQCQKPPKEVAKPIRPVEFRLLIAIPFVGLFIALAILLAVLFTKARSSGLPLPSKNKIVQNILENYIPTATATAIESMWVLINRLLCMLQPLEELQSCKASAKNSVNLNYSSLPPQLVIFKALRSRHFVLVFVCTMAVLANILAIAFAGLFNNDSQEIWNATSFLPPFESKFVTINGTIGPVDTSVYTSSALESGAYHGGEGKDQYFIAESNYTKGTPLPAWTDEKMLYIPFISSVGPQGTNDTQYQARTKAFGAELDCVQLSYGTNYYAKMIALDSDEADMNLKVSVSSGSTTVDCFGRNTVLSGPRVVHHKNGWYSCSTGSSAAEFITHLVARKNATQEEKDTCMVSVVLGWIRDPNGSCGGIRSKNLDESNSLFVRCQPRLVTGNANVLVDARGQLRGKTEVTMTDPDDKGDELNGYFSNDPIHLIGQSNLFLFPNGIAEMHNDTFATDAMNYFVIQENDSIRLVDPNQGVPTLEDVNNLLKATYSRLFAIWLGANKENLLVSSRSKEMAPVSGWTIETRERLFLSTAMFAIAEGILCTYAVVAVLVYLRRPGQYLARLPTCIASIIALFAASSAIEDMKNTSKFDKKERGEHLEKLGSRYGYGSYIGGDGRVHIGIEKVPFVRTRSNPTWFEKKVKSFRSGSGL